LNRQSADEDPESDIYIYIYIYMDQFVEILSGLEHEFAGDPTVKEPIDRERIQVREWIEETLHDGTEDRGEEDKEPDYDFGDYPHAAKYEAERSIFDDIDL
jgi:hypothetical protein